MGLFLPRSTFATSAAKRPNVLPSASTMNHLRSTSAALAINVVFMCDSLPVAHGFIMISYLMSSGANGIHGKIS